MMSNYLAENNKLHFVAIIGSGMLGRRIALMMVAHGATVSIYDNNPQVVISASEYVHEQLPALWEKTGNKDGQLKVCDSLTEAVAQAGLVIEAIPEVLALKQALFAELEQKTDTTCILCSNSSSYPIRQIATSMTPEGRKRVANTHFYMPPVQNPVEVASSGETDAEVIDALMRTLPEFGFVPFCVKKESVGFIFNRVWAAVKRECLEVVATGVAAPEDVDGIYRANLGAPVGPFELMDRIGLDVVYDIEMHYTKINPQLSPEPGLLLKAYIDNGLLGVKTGKGFYSYDEKGRKIG
jgi:3-hydroxybutyryl-CoA dehydrogenase